MKWQEVVQKSIVRKYINIWEVREMKWQEVVQKSIVRKYINYASHFETDENGGAYDVSSDVRPCVGLHEGWAWLSGWCSGGFGDVDGMNVGRRRARRRCKLQTPK
jgi:hypothetical protein